MFMKQHQSIRTKIPGLGQRSLKTALAAVVLALVYYPLNREPTFACIGIIFGMGNNMEDSRLNGGNRLIGTIIGSIKIGKSNKLAGILLLVFGIISLILNWISAILWIIAGIMLLVRKPEPKTFGNDLRSERTGDSYNDSSTEHNEREHQSMKSLDEVEQRKSDDPYKY